MYDDPKLFGEKYKDASHKGHVTPLPMDIYINPTTKSFSTSFTPGWQALTVTEQQMLDLLSGQCDVDYAATKKQKKTCLKAIKREKKNRPKTLNMRVNELEETVQKLQQTLKTMNQRDTK